MNCRISLMSALSSAVSDLSRDSEKSRPGEGSLSRVLFACLIAPTEGFKARSSVVLIVVGGYLNMNCRISLMSARTSVISSLTSVLSVAISALSSVRRSAIFCSHEGNIFFDFRS